MHNMQYITYIHIQKNVFNIYFIIICLNNGTLLLRPGKNLIEMHVAHLLEEQN